MVTGLRSQGLRRSSRDARPGPFGFNSATPFRVEVFVITKSKTYWVALAVAAVVIVAGCSGDDGPSPAEAPVPPKSDPAAYTQYFVESAIARYDTEGLDTTLAHYNSPDSVDGPWYVFVVDRNAEVVAHYDPERLGLSLLGFAGTDLNGYNFGPEMLSADEAGRWVPYVFTNPALGTLSHDSSLEFKNAWVIRHDGLLFGSGWYIDFEQFLPALIAESAEHFRVGGLEAILAFYNDPLGNGETIHQARQDGLTRADQARRAARRTTNRLEPHHAG